MTSERKTALGHFALLGLVVGLFGSMALMVVWPFTQAPRPNEFCVPHLGGKPIIQVNGKDVTGTIRGKRVCVALSMVASSP